MKSEQEQVEGQAVSRAILDGDARAWNQFQEAFGELIENAASGRAKSRKLRAEFSVEDVVHGFMADKLLDQP